MNVELSIDLSIDTPQSLNTTLFGDCLAKHTHFLCSPPFTVISTAQFIDC